VRRLFCGLIILLAPFARAENVTVRVDETVTIEIPGATAAYAIDPLIADVSTPGAGRVSITGRSAGATQLIAVTAGGSQAFLINVAASHPVTTRPRIAAGVPVGTYDANYSSGSSQLRNSVDVFTTEGERRSQFHLLHIHFFGNRFGRDSNALPSMFYRLTTPSRSLTLLDDLVDVSPVTIRSTQVRGIHLMNRGLELHAGYAASTLYEDFFLPADRRWLAGASYGIERGYIRWVPGVYGLFSEPRNSAARRGVIGSLAAEHREGLTFFARGEIAVSRSVAAAADILYDTNRDHLRGRVFYKPDDFPTLGLGDIPGTHGGLEWAHQATDRLAFDSYATFDRFRFSLGSQTTAVANMDLRYSLTPHITMLTGVSDSIVRTPLTSFRTIAVPAGIAFDRPSFGAAASYRVQDTSNSNRHGDTLRLSARAAVRGFRANAWAERQRQAPTIDLIFREEPGLELALLRLGISVRNPEDIARVLRDNAALINLGFIEGVTVNLTPRRLQTGFDAAWLASGDRRDQLRLHAILDRAENISTTRDTLLATLTYSRRLVADMDLYGSYTWWRSRMSLIKTDGSSLEIGLRRRFEGLPSFLRRSGTIQGVVFLDPAMRGTQGPDTTPLADIEVTLDGSRSVRTDPHGVYTLRDVAPGTHRVSARLPSSRPAFFTTPSQAETDLSRHVDFGLIWTPARISGSVISDASLAIGGVALSVTAQNGSQFTATTDSDGQFVLNVPEGQYRLEIVAESLPPGYIFSGQNQQAVVVAADHPEKVSFEVRALRSIAGTIAGASEVRLEPLGRTTATDPSGNFVFRSLPAGTFTITSRSARGTVARTVTLPAEPTSLQDITLDERSVATAAAAASRVQTSPSRPAAATPPGTEGGFRIAVGAFRLASNAIAKQREIERLGFKSDVRRLGSMQIVTVGPFSSRGEAEQQQRRLTAAGIENVIVTNRGREAAQEPSGRAFVVQLGAFREESNARQLIRRLQHIGRRTLTVATDGLTLVQVGPFSSRTAALSESARLHSAGFDTLVMTR
jgi:cell division septation protein DedD